MARHHTKLNQGEQLVLDGWLERIYAEGGVAESDGQLAARLKRQFVAFERSQWEARAARRKAMADSEGADGRVVVEANESDLDAQAKMEGAAAARRGRACRAAALARVAERRAVRRGPAPRQGALAQRTTAGVGSDGEAAARARQGGALAYRTATPSNPALLASLVDAMVDGGTLPESCGGDALGDEDPSFVLDLIKAHLTAARDSAAQLRDRLLEGTQMPVRPSSSRTTPPRPRRRSMRSFPGSCDTCLTQLTELNVHAHVTTACSRSGPSAGSTSSRPIARGRSRSDRRRPPPPPTPAAAGSTAPPSGRGPRSSRG